MRTAFFKALEELAAKDKRIFLVVGDLGYSYVENFCRKFPRQFLNAGVAEQNMTGVAAGLALAGKIVFTYSIGNFPSLRPLEQIRNDICYHRANVKIVSIGAGLHYGALGYSHQAVEDLAILRSLPEMTVISPSDPQIAGLATRALAKDNGPGYLRLSEGEPLYNKKIAFRIGRAILARPGQDLTFISTGAILKNVLIASDRLKEKGFLCRVLDLATIKPIDQSAIKAAALETKKIITIEEHSLLGGLASAVGEVLMTANLPVRFKAIGLKDKISHQVADRPALLAQSGLSPEKIYQSALKMLC